MKLKTEMEVLTSRREKFRNKLDGIEKEMTDFLNNKATLELVAEKTKEMWVKDSVTNNTRIEAVWQKNINGKKEASQKDNHFVKREIKQKNKKPRKTSQKKN